MIIQLNTYNYSSSILGRFFEIFKFIQLNNHKDLGHLKANVDEFDKSNIYINENKMLYSNINI
jgi:hypothetical protein